MAIRPGDGNDEKWVTYISSFLGQIDPLGVGGPGTGVILMDIDKKL